MARIKKYVAAVLATVLLLAGLWGAMAASPADYDVHAPQDLQADHLYAESALLIDAETGEIIFSKDSRVRMYPASTTKIMTLLLALESGIGLDAEVTIPEEAAEIPEGSSVIPIKPGDITTFRDLLYGFMLSSGNDGANAIAALVDGSIGAFVRHMNERAEELGCEGTHFVNAHGYHDPDHFTTAQDLARISRAAMRNEVFRSISAAPSWDMTVTRSGKTGTATILNRNILLQSDSKYYYPECTGIKTGHHRRAGWCFVGSAERDDMRLISVVLNCEEEDQKWYDAARLFEYGFTRYERASAQTLLERLKPVFNNVQITGVADDDEQAGNLFLDLQLTEGGELSRSVLKDSEAALDAAAEQLADSLEIEWTRPLQAPIAEGEMLGTLRCTMPDGGHVTAELTASRDVAEQPPETPTPTAEPTVSATPTPVPDGRSDLRSGRMILAGLAALLIVLVIAAVVLTMREQRRRARRRAHRRTLKVTHREK